MSLSQTLLENFDITQKRIQSQQRKNKTKKKTKLRPNIRSYGRRQRRGVEHGQLQRLRNKFDDGVAKIGHGFVVEVEQSYCIGDN